MIKVAMITRSTFYSSRGGDTIQAQQTAKMLIAQGIAVDIKLSHETINYENYTLLHFFNITRPADILYHIRKSDKPFVVSTILVDYSEYDKKHRKGIAGLLLKYFSTDTIEYIKSMGRFFRGTDKLLGIRYLFTGQRNSIREIIQKTTLLLPNSVAEYNNLQKKYNCKTRHLVVPNGVDPELFSYDDRIKKEPRLVLCVARIEGIKNQVNLIRAMNDTQYKLIIIGEPSPNQQSYYKKCKRMAGNNIQFINHLSQQDLVGYYQRAAVHVLPSWFETTGLSSLEGAAMGCSIVITDKGYTREYFGDHAIYCDPSLPESIYDAVERAATRPYDDELRQEIRSLYTWRRAGICTAEGYKRIISESWD